MNSEDAEWNVPSEIAEEGSSFGGKQEGSATGEAWNRGDARLICDAFTGGTIAVGMVNQG